MAIYIKLVVSHYRKGEVVIQALRNIGKLDINCVTGNYVAYLGKTFN